MSSSLSGFGALCRSRGYALALVCLWVTLWGLALPASAKAGDASSVSRYSLEQTATEEMVPALMILEIPWS